MYVYVYVYRCVYILRGDTIVLRGDGAAEGEPPMLEMCMGGGGAGGSEFAAVELALKDVRGRLTALTFTLRPPAGLACPRHLIIPLTHNPRHLI
jgi:hypothetical protein